MELRRIEEQTEMRRQAIGVQGHNSFEVHAKVGILDPMRHVVELMDWQSEVIDLDNLRAPINEAYQIMAGVERVADSLTVEVATRYYLQGESWHEIIDGYTRNGVRTPPISERVESLSDVPRAKQFSWCEKAMKLAIDQWEKIGIAHLKEMGA